MTLGYGPPGDLGYGPIGEGGPHRGEHGGGSVRGSVPYLSGFTLNDNLPQKNSSIQSQIIKLVYYFTKNNQHVIMFKCAPSSLVNL